MKKISVEEMRKIKGGLNITGTFLSYMIRGVNSFADLGRSLGTAVRRISANKVCPL